MALPIRSGNTSFPSRDGKGALPGAVRMFSTPPTRSGNTWRRHSCLPGRDSSRPLLRRGFTLIEMMIVMAIIVILISVAVPYYQKAIIRAKESVLHNNLMAMRSAIDEYTYDKQKAPQTLQDLVSAGYLHDVPEDPIAKTHEWKTIIEDSAQAVDQTEPGIFDVRSESDKMSSEGTPYSDW